MRKMILQQSFKVRAIMNRNMLIKDETCQPQSILVVPIQTSKNLYLLQATPSLISRLGKIITKPVRHKVKYNIITKRVRTLKKHSIMNILVIYNQILYSQLEMRIAVTFQLKLIS